MALPHEPSESDSKRLAWQVVSTGTGLLAAVLTQRALTALWTRYVGVPDVGPPNPADRRINWSEAIIWAVAVGVGGGLARLVAQRLAVKGWELATGEAPPPVGSATDVG